jgi:hypothetical protein
MPEKELIPAMRAPVPALTQPSSYAKLGSSMGNSKATAIAR